VAALVVALVGLLLAAPAAAQNESLLPPTCEALLAPGNFSTRFRVIDPLARVTACRMKGVIADDVFDLLVPDRVAQWSRRCFSEREQAYLRGVLRQATMQSMPFVTEENCAANLERLLMLPEPRKPR
jgi:hypothetical protein